jgi:hypothetical protein
MRFMNLTVITLAVAVASCFCMAWAVEAQDASAPPAHHDQPVAPPDSLKPGAPMDSDNDANAAGNALAQDRAIPMGGGVEIACTGIGSEHDDPQWKSWPIRIEFSNGAGQFLLGEHVTLSKGGHQIADFDCKANWVMFRGPMGDYTAVASLTDHPGVTHSAHFSPPSSGQKVVEIQFPGLPANQ